MDNYFCNSAQETNLEQVKKVMTAKFEKLKKDYHKETKNLFNK